MKPRFANIMDKTAGAYWRGDGIVATLLQHKAAWWQIKAMRHAAEARKRRSSKAA